MPSPSTMRWLGSNELSVVSRAGALRRHTPRESGSAHCGDLGVACGRGRPPHRRRRQLLAITSRRTTGTDRPSYGGVPVFQYPLVALRVLRSACKLRDKPTRQARRCSRLLRISASKQENAWTRSLGSAQRLVVYCATYCCRFSDDDATAASAFLRSLVSSSDSQAEEGPVNPVKSRLGGLLIAWQNAPHTGRLRPLGADRSVARRSR